MTISGTPLARHFYGVRVTQSVRGEAAAHAGLRSDVSELSAHRGLTKRAREWVR